MKPRLLDLFCGAGAIARGYEAAGWDVFGVDIKPQPRYPFAVIEMNALRFLRVLLDGKAWPVGSAYLGLENFDAIHASPPCPFHSSLTGWGRHRAVETAAVDLIPPLRELLIATNLPYVIENVKRKALIDPVRICGQGLGLPVRRHRFFESNVPLMGVPCHHPGPPVIVVRGSIGRKVFDPRRKAIAPTLAEARVIMGLPNGTAGECADAVPAAYGEVIGHQLLAHIRAEAVA